MSSRLWVWSAVVLLCTAGPAAAQPPSPLELASGIREAGLPDLALEYLKEIEPKLKAAEKTLLPLERAKCLLDAADDEPDEGTRTSMINEAKLAFDAFLTTQANHPRAAEASMALAKLTSVEAKAQLNRARRMEVPSEEGPARDQAITKQKAEMEKAQPLFLLASSRFAAAAKQMKAKLDALPPNDPQRVPLAREIFDADLAAAINEYNLADTFLPTSAAIKLKRDEFLEKSRRRFEDLAKGPQTSRTVWIAKAWMAEILADQGKPTEAKTEFTAILNAPRAEAEEGKRLVKFFQLRRDYLEALTEGNLPKLATVETALRSWLGRYGTTQKPPAEVIAARYYLAVALQRQGINLMPKTPGAPLSEACSRKFGEAEKLYRGLSQFDHDYTDRSAKNRMFVVRRLLGEADKPVSEYTSFESAQMAGLIQIAKMNDAEKALTTAKFDEESLDTAPFWTACRGRLNLAYLEDEVEDRKLRVIALLERARGLAKDSDPPADVTDNLLRLVYFYQTTDQPHQAAILGEHIARTIRTTGGKGALAGLMALNGYTIATSKIKGSDDPAKAEESAVAVAAARKADRERAIACARFMHEKFPNDTATDNARHRLAVLLYEEGKLDQAFDIITKVRPGYTAYMSARQFEGFLAVSLINPKDKDGPTVSQQRKLAIYRQAIGDLARLGKPGLGASKEDVRGYIGCRLRLAFLYLSQNRADEETEKTNPGFVSALAVADELVATVPSYKASQDEKQQLSLDGLEFLYQAYDLRTRALYLRAKALVADNKFDEAISVITGAQTEVSKPLFDDRMKKWAGGSGDGSDDETVSKQKSLIASLASTVDRVRRDIVMVGFKIRCIQGNPTEAGNMLNLLKAAGGGIETNQASLELMARELAAHIPELRKEAAELTAANKKPEAAAKLKEAADLGAGLALLLKEFTAIKDLPVPTILFLGQTFYTIGEWDNGINEFKKIKPPTEPDWDKKKIEDFAAEIRGKLTKEIALYRYAQLMIAKCLRGGGKYPEAEKMLQAAIAGYASSSADFRKELATLYETRAATITDPKDAKAANAQWGLALKEWTTLFQYAQAGVRGLKPESPPQVVKQVKSHFADSYFEIQRVLALANTQLVKDPGKLAEKMDAIAKSILGLETANKYNDIKMIDGPDGKKIPIKAGTELISFEVWTRYCDFLDKYPVAKESYKKQGGKFFLERPKPE